MKSLESLKEKNNEVKILGLDVSSTCTGYAVLTCDFLTRKATVTSAGALWLSNNTDNALKYNYISKCLSEYFYILGYMDYLVHEQYSINMKKAQGIMVTPEMIGAIKATVAELGVSYESISPQSWRKELGIKADITEKNGKRERDYKGPTKEWVNNLTCVPDTIISNITGKERNTPSDVYDAIAVIFAWAQKLTGANDERFFRKVSIDKKLEINPHLGFNTMGKD